MPIAYIIVLSTDALLAAVGLILIQRDAIQKSAAPALISIGAFIAALTVHALGCAIAVGWEYATEGNVNPWGKLISAVIGVVPMMFYAKLLLDGVSGSAGRALFTPQGSGPRVEDFAAPRALASKGKVEEAVRAYRELAKRFPASPEPLLAAAGILEAHGRFAEAGKLLRGVRAEFKAPGEGWRKATERLAVLCENDLALPEEAHQFRDELRRIAGEEPRVALHERKASLNHEHKLRAQRLAREDRVADAVEAYRAQYRIQPDTPRFLFAAAAELEKRGDYYGAAEVLREAVRDFQKHEEFWPDSAYRLAVLLERDLADIASARGLYREIIKRAPSTKTGRLAGARLRELIE